VAGEARVLQSSSPVARERRRSAVVHDACTIVNGRDKPDDRVRAYESQRVDERDDPHVLGRAGNDTPTRRAARRGAEFPSGISSARVAVRLRLEHGDARGQRLRRPARAMKAHSNCGG